MKIKEEIIIPEWKEKTGNNSGCLINSLSIIGSFIVLVLGVSIQEANSSGSNGPDGPGSAIIIAAVFVAFYFIKKSLNKHFNKQK